jgi:hypothetical protein
MRYLFLVFTLLVTACTLNDPDDIASQQVVVPTPTNRLGAWSDYPSLDVTSTKIVRY